tara:strand:- start:139 stop:369 length:231 start_codon:yes stop_codon:yes gene_type:complete
VSPFFCNSKKKIGKNSADKNFQRDFFFLRLPLFFNILLPLSPSQTILRFRTAKTTKNGVFSPKNGVEHHNMVLQIP